LLFEEGRDNRRARRKGGAAAGARHRHADQFRNVRTRIRRWAFRALLGLDGRLGRYVRRRGRLCAEPVRLSREPRWEAGAALAKGAIILVFGIAVLVGIADKIANGVPPSSSLMLAFGTMALIANLICLALLWRFRHANVNMSSTFECSRNDVISNLGVLAAAALVWGFASPWPDIAVGAVIAVLFLRSVFRVLRAAWPVWRTPDRCRPRHCDDSMRRID
jgi:hypothetical protein